MFENEQGNKIPSVFMHVKKATRVGDMVRFGLEDREETSPQAA